MAAWQRFAYDWSAQAPALSGTTSGTTTSSGTAAGTAEVIVAGTGAASGSTTSEGSIAGSCSCSGWTEGETTTGAPAITGTPLISGGAGGVTEGDGVVVDPSPIVVTPPAPAPIYSDPSRSRYSAALQRLNRPRLTVAAGSAGGTTSSAGSVAGVAMLTVAPARPVGSPVVAARQRERPRRHRDDELILVGLLLSDEL